MIPTGITKLDNFLNGGITQGTIVDIFGASATGKTQIALQIAVNCISKNKHILFHDTKGEFRPERIIDMLKAKGLSNKLLENIDVKRITNSSDQINSIKEESISKYSLLIIDNITELFSYEYSDDNQLLAKNIVFMKYLHALSLIGLEKNIAIVFTNMIRNQDGNEIENMAKAAEPFTHIKVHLTKTNNKFKGEAKFLLNKLNFYYSIVRDGVIDST